MTAVLTRTPGGRRGSPPARAQNSGDLPSGPFSQVYRRVRELVRAGTEMNTVYQGLLNRLPATARQLLRQSRRAWMARRDRDCVEYDGNRGDVVDTPGALDTTTWRLNFLNDRWRECSNSGGRPGKLRRCPQLPCTSPRSTSAG